MTTISEIVIIVNLPAPSSGRTLCGSESERRLNVRVILSVLSYHGRHSAVETQ